MARTDPQVNLRIPAELKDALDAAAVENKRSLTAEIVDRLQDSLRLRDVTDATMLRLQDEIRAHRSETAALRTEAAQLRTELTFTAETCRRLEAEVGTDSPLFLEALERFDAAKAEYNDKMREVRKMQEAGIELGLLQTANEVERRKRGLKPVFTETELNSMKYVGPTKG